MSKKLLLRAITSCGVLIALSVVLARLLAVAPTASSRYSLETLPIFLAGLLFGPAAGALVGFSSDFLGCLLSPYGYNPLLSIPPIFLGLFAGLCAKRIAQKPDWLRFLLALAVPIVAGYMLLQSVFMALLFSPDSFTPFFLSKLLERSLWYSLILALDLVLSKTLYPVLRRLQ